MQIMSGESLRPTFCDVPFEADGFRTMQSVQLMIRNVVNQRMLIALGVQFSQGSALVHLARSDTMSCQALANLLGCGTSRLTRLAQDLERRALIVRRRNGQDRRALDLSLTSRGMEIAERVPFVVSEAEQVVLGRLSMEERMILKRFLQRILREIDA
ncbi:MarR family winged helix-turn-helix transcriptional regulator [Burkholderia lata]|uniref:Transcriptional regulator, MarR family n=1 Tax=Burkholderia lata (strain ATCC 17760 / DSM 23089 / LMG 22485 / NCIMB 9086 / R18194 / 383) TaxID=482957 RepID=Q39PK8_BURL3|nr:MarR family transcriptional regulator [Burkholderia lata]ABB05608.1 transcriptional regulator, MarR family [Burkholderia lata]